MMKSKEQDFIVLFKNIYFFKRWLKNMMKSGEQDFYNLSPDHQEYPYKVLKHYKVWNLRNILTKLYVKFVKKDSTIERGI